MISSSLGLLECFRSVEQLQNLLSPSLLIWIQGSWENIVPRSSKNSLRLFSFSCLLLLHEPSTETLTLVTRSTSLRYCFTWTGIKGKWTTARITAEFCSEIQRPIKMPLSAEEQHDGKKTLSTMAAILTERYTCQINTEIKLENGDYMQGKLELTKVTGEKAQTSFKTLSQTICLCTETTYQP